MGKARELLRKIFGVVFFAVFVLVFVSNLFSVFPLRAQPMIVALIAVLIIAAGFCATCVFGSVRITKPKVSETAFLIIVFAFYALVQGFVAYEFETQFTQGWDFGIVASAARDFALYDLPAGDYFSKWPNNIPIYIFLCNFFKLCGSFGYYAFSRAGILLNLILIDIAHFLVYMTAKHIGGRRLGFAALICSMMNPAMLAYSGIYYTDTLSLVFPISALLLWICAKENFAKNKNRRAIVQTVSAAALLAVGTVMKMTVIILLIAVIIDIFMSFDIKKAAMRAAVSACVFALLFTGLNYSVMSSPQLPQADENLYIPKLHWVMMGLHGNGNYYDPDYQLTLSVPHEQRDELVKSEIAARIKEFGFGGMLSHFAEKASYVWGDGTYSSCFKIDRDRVRASSLDRYMKIDGEAFAPYARYSQGVMAATILGMALCGILVVKDKKYGTLLLAPCACVFGVLLFFLVWEARSRYIFNYIPIFTILAVCAYSELFRYLGKKIKTERK
ncbi:MAG: glycosyltransferase family 39 protein [Oscillospiraceae bacterium]